MERMNTQINGLSTSLSYPDGDCRVLVGLRPGNGGLIPIASCKREHELSAEYDIVFVHHVGGEENWIGTKYDSSNRCTLVFVHILKDPTVSLPSIYGRVFQIQQIGTTLSFVSDRGVFYAIEEKDVNGNSSYTFLGEIPELPAVSFSSYNTVYSTILYKDEYPDGVTMGTFKERTKAILYKARELSNGASDFNFFDAFYIRYAFRLYDGSLTKHSPLILWMPKNNLLDTKKLFKN